MGTLKKVIGESPIQPELPAYTGEVTAKGTKKKAMWESPIQPELQNIQEKWQ